MQTFGARLRSLRAVILSLSFILACADLCAQITETYTFPAGRMIPDGNAAGISDSHNLLSTITNLTSVKVGVRIPGEFNGDLYGYIRHAGRLVIILNRPGKTAADDHGYADQGLDITCQTAATNGDIHSYRDITIPPIAASLSGVWEPDGRGLDPAIVTDVSSRSTSFTNFNGLAASGDWTLYVADIESGGTNFLTEWSLEIAGIAPPPHTNSPPIFAEITNRVISPDLGLNILLEAHDPDDDALTFSLDPGAPAGSIITNFVWLRPTPTTNYFLRWFPTRAMASTTNVFTVRVTDNGLPPLSVTQSFIVTVLDYLDLGIGSTNLQAGQTASVPITLSSDGGVTGMTFNVPWAGAYFTNATLSVTAPGIGSADLQDQTTNLLIMLQATAGQPLQGTQEVAQLSFRARTNGSSGFIDLPLRDVIGLKPGSITYSNYVLHPGMVAVVQNEPLLAPHVSSNASRDVMLFGKLGAGYQLQVLNQSRRAKWLVSTVGLCANQWGY